MYKSIVPRRRGSEENVIGPTQSQDGSFEFHSLAYDRHGRAFAAERQRLRRIAGSTGRNEITARHVAAMLFHLRAMYQIVKREAQERAGSLATPGRGFGAAA